MCQLFVWWRRTSLSRCLKWQKECVEVVSFTPLERVQQRVAFAVLEILNECNFVSISHRLNIWKMRRGFYVDITGTSALQIWSVALFLTALGSRSIPFLGWCEFLNAHWSKFQGDTEFLPWGRTNSSWMIGWESFSSWRASCGSVWKCVIARSASCGPRSTGTVVVLAVGLPCKTYFGRVSRPDVERGAKWRSSATPLSSSKDAGFFFRKMGTSSSPWTRVVGITVYSSAKPFASTLANQELVAHETQMESWVHFKRQAPGRYTNTVPLRRHMWRWPPLSLTLSVACWWPWPGYPWMESLASQYPYVDAIRIQSPALQALTLHLGANGVRRWYDSSSFLRLALLSRVSFLFAVPQTASETPPSSSSVRIGQQCCKQHVASIWKTADHKVLSEWCESRNSHRYTVVVQELTTQWLQSNSCETKTSQETQKNLMKFLVPTRKPKVIYTDNSLDFGKSCEDLPWHRCASTPHTDWKQMGLLREQYAGFKKGLLQYCCNQVWIVAFGATVEYHPIHAEDLSRLHQFGPKVLPGIFLGYVLRAVGIWEGETFWLQTLRNWKRWTHLKSIRKDSMQRKCQRQ